MNELRTLPHDLESEQGALGSVLLDASTAMQRCMIAGLSEEILHDHRHSLLFRELLEMHQNAQPIDSITLSSHLAKKELLEKVGGRDYLLKLQNVALVPDHCQHYTGNILEAFVRRRAIQCATELIDAAYNNKDISDILEKVQDIGTDRMSRRTRQQVIDDAKTMTRSMASGQFAGIPTPFEKFNRDTMGIPRGIVCPLAGRSGKGKSMMKAFMSCYLAKRGTPVLDMCFEDNDSKTAMRVAAALGGYDLFALQRGTCSPRNLAHHEKCLERLRTLPYDTHQESCTVEDAAILIGEWVRLNEQAIRKNGGVVYIDGIKDMIPSKGDNKTGQEEHISSVLSRCAVKHRDITIIPVTHLTKIDSDQWINLNDIRGSSLQVSNARAVMLFQDADFPVDILTEARGNTDNLVVLQMAKTNYGNEGKIVLRKDFQRGWFTEEL